MADPHMNLIERYPEYEAQIRALTETNPAFNTMAHEFNAVCEELSRAHGGADADLDPEDLQRRKQALQDEMEMLLRQTSRL